VRSLKEHVETQLERRADRTGHRPKKREHDDALFKDLITTLELDHESPKSEQLLRSISLGNGDLYLFLGRNPDWRHRLQAQLLEINKALEKLERHLEVKQAEKQRIRALQKAIQKKTKASSTN
jgi:hypothetical protein